MDRNDRVEDVECINCKLPLKISELKIWKRGKLKTKPVLCPNCNVDLTFYLSDKWGIKHNEVADEVWAEGGRYLEKF